MGKTLVIAEKPSVGRDLAGALPGTSRSTTPTSSRTTTSSRGRSGTSSASPRPRTTTTELKKWRFADLPIVPERFRLIPNDEKAKKQLRAVHKLLKRRPDVDRIVNACDAGREGELIFAYVYETVRRRQAGRSASGSTR